MEKIKLSITKNDNDFSLAIDSNIKQNIECLKLEILSVEINPDKNDVIHINVCKNQFYKTKEIGAYLNVIYINDTFYSKEDGVNAEIRLSLICQIQSNIKHIFINGIKSLQ